MTSPRHTAALTCLATLLSAAAWGQTPPERVGPPAQEDALGPRVFTVQADQGLEDSATESAEPVATAQAAPRGQRLREQRRQVAEARLEEAHGQQRRISRFLHPIPEVRQFQSSLVAPMTPSFRPLRMQDPVQMFQPSSTFSHVLRQADENAEDAQREIAVLSQPATDDPPLAEHRPVEAIDAELRLTEFRLRSAQLRLRQLENQSRLTYSLLYANLGAKLRTEILSHELATKRLQQERDQQLRPAKPAGATRERTVAGR